MGVLTVDLLVVCPHILLLDERSVRKHERTQVARRRSTVYISLETHLHYIWYQTRMVDMGMT